MVWRRTRVDSDSTSPSTRSAWESPKWPRPSAGETIDCIRICIGSTPAAASSHHTARQAAPEHLLAGPERLVDRDRTPADPSTRGRAGTADQVRPADEARSRPARRSSTPRRRRSSPSRHAPARGRRSAARRPPTVPRSSASTTGSSSERVSIGDSGNVGCIPPISPGSLSTTATTRRGRGRALLRGPRRHGGGERAGQLGGRRRSAPRRPRRRQREGDRTEHSDPHRAVPSVIGRRRPGPDGRGTRAVASNSGSGQVGARPRRRRREPRESGSSIRRRPGAATRTPAMPLTAWASEGRGRRPQDRHRRERGWAARAKSTACATVIGRHRTDRCGEAERKIRCRH